MAQRVAAEVRAEMARQGLTPSTVAAACDMSRSSLHRKLAARSDFTLPEAASVSAALGLTLSALVERAENVKAVA